MNRSTIFAVSCGVALVSGGAIHAEIGSRARGALVSEHKSQLPTHLDPTFVRRDSVSTLRINNVRLEPAAPEVPKPSTVLKFDMLNDGALRVSDVLVQIAILDKRSTDDGATVPRVIVGPFAIQGHVTVEAGYTVNYEMLLRNLPSDCGCVADVSVVSARPVPVSGS